MPARAIVLTALIASCVSSLVTLAAALLLLAPAIRAAPDPQATQPLVRAERFELVDSQGRMLARLAQSGGGEPAGSGILLGGVVLDFFDQTGQVRALIGLGNTGSPGLALVNSQGLVAGIGENLGTSQISPGSMEIVLAGASPVAPNAVLSLETDGQSSLRFLDTSGQIRLVQGIRADGTPWIEP